MQEGGDVGASALMGLREIVQVLPRELLEFLLPTLLVHSMQVLSNSPVTLLLLLISS